MALNSGAGRSRDTMQSVDMSWDGSGGDRPDEPGRDWKKLFLVAGLGLLSWVATYVGMLELIEANMGELPLVHKLIIGFSVAMLMVMVVWLLDQMFSDIGWFTRLLFGAGYVFLTVISVGFGFGFYWKVLESRSEASRSAESAVGQVQTSLHAAMTRLEQLQGTLDSLTTVSTQKADTERQAGTSCPNSKPGDGPRRKMRDDDAARFKFAADFVKGRVSAVRTDIAALEGDLAKITKDDKSTVDERSGTRNEFMRNLGRKLDMTVAGFNAFRTDPQLKQIRIDLNERADKVTFVDTKGGTYTCPDSQLTTALKGVVRAIDELPVLEKPKIAAVEGSEAVIEAFRRLTATFYGMLAFKLPPTPEELRELQKKAMQSVDGQGAPAKVVASTDQAGLSKRDYVPLAIALFVDLCLLLVSIRRGGDRLQSLVPKMRAAERGPVIQILSRFNEIHRDKQIRENFEVFRHVVFDFHGDYYAAVPLNAPYRPNPRNGDQRQGYGPSDAQELLQEAHLLGNLFASFEQERIFTRVYSPLLSTRTVQKRLRRQGSKFANSEAFRIYRFRNGAWSEIILGAVMGAARRVEDEKRRRRVEEEMFAPGHEPVVRTSEVGPRSGTGHGEAHVAFGSGPTTRPGDGHAALAGSRRRHASLDDAGAVLPESDPYRGRQSGSAGLADLGDYRAPAAAAAAGQFSMQRAPSPWPRPSGTLDDAPPLTARPANNNTAPVARETAEHAVPAAAAVAQPSHENIVLHPAVARPQQAGSAHSHHATEGALAVAIEPVPAEPTVTVAATRETVTYTLPMSEAALPQSVVQAAACRPEVPAIDARAVEALATASLPPPLPPQAEPGTDGVIALPEAAAELAARHEQQAWEEAAAAGWSPANAAGAFEDPRTLALRLRPERRDG